MKNLVSLIVILLVVTSTAAAADYWHFSIGLRGTGVIPGEDYSNAFGVGVVASLGDPDSKFATHFEVDNWKVIYDYSGSDTTFTGREHHYSGLGFGIFEKYRFFNSSSRYSPYAIGGVGAYFLELKREEDTDVVGVQLRSQYIHSLFSLSGGLGVEGRVSSNLSAFLEGRYVGVFSEFDEDKDLIQTYLGLKYLF
ncbi:MAG: hypothetical protein V3W18_14020 [candidate division Zixibacteria bacterium]